MQSTCRLTAIALAFALDASAAPPHVPAQPPAAGAVVPPPHWSTVLGLRAHQVEQAFPLIDRVVLVPDTATYLDELAKWSPRGTLAGADRG